MRHVLMIGVAIFAMGFCTGTLQAVEYKWTGDKFVEVNGNETVKPVLTSQPVTIPRGFHAHEITDANGNKHTIVHSDKNVGSALAHEGVAPGWKKSAYAGDTVIVDSTTTTANPFLIAAGPCPNGVCPATAGRRASDLHRHRHGKNGPQRVEQSERVICPYRRELPSAAS